MAKSPFVILTSENLIVNKKHRERCGPNVGSMAESLFLIEEGLQKLSDGTMENGVNHLGPFEDKLPEIEASGKNREDDSDTQLNVKLFLRGYDQKVAIEAVNNAIRALATDHIDNLHVTVPAEGIQYIGISPYSEDERTSFEGGTTDDQDEDLVELDPEREKYANHLASLWNALSSMPCIGVLGLCDVETDVFKKIYREVDIKPSNVQINLVSCCVVPPKLRSFATSKNIKLLTHSDSPEILSDKFCAKVAQFTSEPWQPVWIVKLHVFKKLRGVLEDKRYIVALQKQQEKDAKSLKGGMAKMW